jgi:hypothetical protein
MGRRPRLVFVVVLVIVSEDPPDYKDEDEKEDAGPARAC